MANVQHIYHCSGDPDVEIPTNPSQACHHAIDDLTGDIYISNGVKWLLSASSQTDGAVSGISLAGAPAAKPVGWPTKIHIDESTGDVYISVFGSPSPEWFKFTGTKVIFS